MKILKMILSFGKRYPGHIICKANLYLHLPESFCIFIACRSLHMIGYFGRAVVVGGHRNSLI